MSQFAGLDFSDNEDEQPKKVAVKKSTTKDSNKEVANKTKAETKPKGKT